MARVLLAVASRNGATLRIARRFGRALEERGVTVDLVHLAGEAAGATGHVTADDDVDLTAYDAVVLGSPVYAGRWLAAASRFAEAHSSALCRRPIWVFSREAVVALAEDVYRVEIRGLPGTAEAVRYDAFGNRGPRRGFPTQGPVRSAAPVHPDGRAEWPVISAWARDVAVTLDRIPARTA
jgi:menaquinone-dependent protoporphyrinogen oxidase